MPVNTPGIEINPYTSTVPTVQVPPQEFGNTAPSGPLQGQFGGGKGSGGLAIGDSILKGFLQGHEYKAQKKAAEAQATLAAADAATSAAHQKYQDALVAAQGNVNDPNAKAAYAAYTDVFNKSKEAKAKFVIPEEPKKATGKGAKDKLKAGFSNIKGWMEANPHVIPQLALASMQPQPQGMTPESKKAAYEQAREQQDLAAGKLEQEEAARKQGAQKIYDQFSGLNDEQLAALPESTQAQFRSAKNVLFPPRETGATKLYDLGDGKKGWFIPGQEPAGAQPIVNTAGGATKGLGSLPDYLTRYAKQNGISTDQLTTQDIDYVKAQLAFDTAHGGTTSTTVRPGIDSTTTTSSRSVGPPPAPPRGRAGFGSDGPPPMPTSSTPRGGGMTPISASRGGGRMTRPGGAPSSSSSPSPTRARLTMQVNNEKTTRYQKAQDARLKAYAKAEKDFAGDNDAIGVAKKQADAEFSAASKSIEDWYNQQVRAVGGTPGGGKSEGSKNVKYYQGHAYQQDPTTKQWTLLATATQ